MKRGRILVVDDEQSMRDFLGIFLRKQEYEVCCVENGVLALEHIKSSPVDLVISDIRMPEMDGMSLLKEARRFKPDVQFLVMTAYSSTADAIKATDAGAYDYITKPFKLNDIKVTIERAIRNIGHDDNGEKNSDDYQNEIHVEGIIGRSPQIREVFKMISRVATTNASVLISGESGTGKELVARALHQNSQRSGRPFVTVNCGAIPSELMESELFGHVKGSFTGAIRDKDGLFTVVNGGSLFLDEVSELDIQLQVKLLRAIQERKVMPVGGTREISVDVRLITATNRDLQKEVDQARFREDLYYRLNVIQIGLPALRERRDDIPILIQHFIKQSCNDLGRPQLNVSEAAMMIMINYDYPGNVRELSNIIERAVALETSDRIRPASLPPAMLDQVLERSSQVIRAEELVGDSIDAESGATLDKVLEQHERRYIDDAMKKADGVKTEAAKILGVSFRSLRYRMKKLGMDMGPVENEEE